MLVCDLVLCYIVNHFLVFCFWQPSDVSTRWKWVCTTIHVYQSFSFCLIFAFISVCNFYERRFTVLIFQRAFDIIMSWKEETKSLFQIGIFWILEGEGLSGITICTWYMYSKINQRGQSTSIMSLSLSISLSATDY